MDFSSLCASFLFHFIFIFYFLSVMRVFVPLLKRSYFLFFCVVDLVFYIISISCSPPTMRGERRGFRRKSKSKNETSRNQYVAHVFSRLHHKKERKRISVHLYPIPSRFSLSANVFNWIYYCCFCCYCFCCFPNQIAHRCILSGLTFTQNTERIRRAHIHTRARVSSPCLY